MIMSLFQMGAVKMRLVKCETKHYETVLDNGLSASFTHLSRPSFMASFKKLGSLHQNKHYHYFFARHKTVSLIFLRSKSQAMQSTILGGYQL